MPARRPASSGDEELFPSLAGQGMVGIDTENYDPDIKTKGSGAFRDGRLVGVSVATEAGFARYYPVGHEAGGNMDKRKVLGWLQDQLKLKVPKVGAHLLHDLSYLHVEGVRAEGPFYDVQNAEPLLTEDRFQYSLDAIAKDYLGVGKKDEELDAWLKEKFGRKNPKGNIWRAPPEVVGPYAVEDAVLPLKIFAKQRPLLQERKLWSLFEDVETPLVPMLLAMRVRGVRVDLKRAHQMHDELSAKKAQILAEVRRVAGRDVEIWAAKSIAGTFDALGLEYPLTPKTKQPSFTASFLENSDHPVARMVVEARRIDKMLGTFLEGGIFESQVRGRIHCQFNQLKSDEGGAVSGRFSSSNPNLQFIPIRTEEGRKIREMFLADAGQDWYKLDWSQVEYRLIVHDAACLGLRGAAEVVQRYHDDPDTDYHQAIADMTGLGRGPAKTLNFGLAYGEGLEKLCRQLGLERREGEALINEYHRRAPFIRMLMRHLSSLAGRTGEVRTLLNRVRQFNTWVAKKRVNGEIQEIFTRKPIPGSRRAFTHKALNARIQGSAADLMKRAMVLVWQSGACDVLGVPQLTVHDELDGSVPQTKAGREALAEVKRIMEEVVPLRVPLKVDLSVGRNWGQAK